MLFDHLQMFKFISFFPPNLEWTIHVNWNKKCEVAECENVFHPSCCKNLMAKFGKDEWEGPSFCGKCCFKQNKKSLAAVNQ